MGSKTIKLSKEAIFQLKDRFPKAEVRKTPPYAYYQIRLHDCVITAYESGKVLFQGEGAEFYASGFSQPAGNHKNINIRDRYPQCGSDEVGTGDYFGPVTVCACCVTKEDVPFLKELGIQDSKAISDEKIRIMGPQLTKRLTHSLLILDNTTYNRIHPDNNMVAIKTKLHNQAYVHLKHKLTSLPDLCVIDQFVQSSSYYRYLKQEKEVIRDIHFETKAENKFLSVASASIIARYAFLKAFDHMCEKYSFTFLKGASYKVDQNIREFVALHGKEALIDVAKLHFANTKKALGE